MGMFLNVLYTEMSLYQIFSGNVTSMARRLSVMLLYLSFMVMLLIILYLLVWEWLKNGRKELHVLVLCGQTDLGLYQMFCGMFFFWYLLSYIVGSVIFCFCVRFAKVLWVVYGIGGGGAILLFLQIVFVHTIIRRYFFSLLEHIEKSEK